MNCPNCGKKVKDNAKKCPHCKEILTDKTNKIKFFDNKWEVVDLIGEGSFGKVYKAKKEEFGLISYSAIKTINIPQNRSEIQELKNEGMNNEEICEYYQNFVKKWLDEIKLMQSLKSSLNVVNVEDYEVIEDVKKNTWKINIRMELLEGIESFYEGKNITNKDILKMGIDIAKALDHCKKYNIIHRDIKPDNIFISELGDYKLGDFGIARNLEKTTSGLSKKGTYTYMAPEVYKGLEYNRTIDIYSLGLVLYKYFNSGRLPFLPAYPKKMTFEDKESSIMKRMNGDKIAKPVNATTEEAKIILKMIAFDPKDRYKTASSLINDLEKVYNETEVRTIVEAKVEKNDTESTGKHRPDTILISDDKKEKGTVSVNKKKSERTVSVLDDKKLDATVSVLDEKKLEATVSVLDEKNLDKTVLVNGDIDDINKVNAKKNKKHKLNKKVKVLISSIAIILIAVILSTVYFVMNYCRVPNVVGLSSEEAIQKLKDLELSEEIINKVTNEEDQIGTIIEQENEGKIIKKKSIIKITIGVSSNKVPMINVVGLELEEAKNRVKEIEITINSSETYDDKIPEGIIISQTIQEGEEIPKGSVVDVLVSKGKKEEKKDNKDKNNNKNNSSKKDDTNKKDDPVKKEDPVKKDDPVKNEDPVKKDETNKKDEEEKPTPTTTEQKKNPWSSWVSTLPSSVSNNKSKYNIQTKTQYRSRKKEFTTGTSASKSGWTKYDQKTNYSAWSANKTSTNKVTASDLLEIVNTDSRVTSVTWYHWDNQYWSGAWGIDSIATWELNSIYHEITAPIDAGFGIYYDYDRGGQQMYSNGAYFCPNGWQVWFRGAEHRTTTYTYRTRTKTTTYYFYRFGSWSSWSDSKITKNDNLEVETRTLYRYQKK